MAKKKNQKFGMPFFRTPKRKIIQRKEFLSGKLKTYYTPGQNPDVGEPNNYTTPSSHWLPSNEILYRPQTVWLYIGVPFPYNTKYAQNTVLTKVADHTPIYSFGTGINGGLAPGGTYVYIGDFYPNGRIFVQAEWNVINPNVPIVTPPSNDLGGWTLSTAAGVFPPKWTQTVGGGFDHQYLENTYPGEKQRIKDIYDAVKLRIEQIRPDRTFVQVIDPWIYDPFTDIYPHSPFPEKQNYLYYGVKDQYFLNYSYDNNPFTIQSVLDSTGNIRFKLVGIPEWETMVPTDVDDYFGVNFYYIYSGSPSNVAITQRGQAEVGEPRYDLIQDAAQKFCQYTVNMFGLDVNIPHESLVDVNSVGLIPPTKIIFPGIPAGPPAPPPAPPPISVPPWKVYTPSEWPPGGVIGNYGTPWTTNSIDLNQLNKNITNLNTSRDSINTSDIQYLQDEINQLVNLGVDAAYIGETSLIEVDYLVNLIAKHYKFNPKTGKDLPK